MAKLSSTVIYRERVLPTLGFYAASLFLPAAAFLVTLPFSDQFGLILASFSMLGVILVSWFMSPTITLTPQYLSIGRVTVGREFLGKANEVSKDQAFLERGRHLDPRAFTRFSIGVSHLVKIQINDELDPAPYWLIATRNPEILAGLINKY